jgi:hypothetical protein
VGLHCFLCIAIKISEKQSIDLHPEGFQVATYALSFSGARVVLLWWPACHADGSNTDVLGVMTRHADLMFQDRTI